MIVLSEPTTLAEMHARKRAADRRQAETAARLAKARKEEEARRAAREARLRQEYEDEKKWRALEDRKRMDALVHQVIKPERLAREPRAVIRRVAQEHGLTYDDIVGPSLKHHVTRARHVAVIAVAQARPDLSLHALARHMGGRHHTTVLYALQQHYGQDYKHGKTPLTPKD